MKFNNFTDFNKQFGEKTIAEFLYMSTLGKLFEGDYDPCGEVEIKVTINGVECDMKKFFDVIDDAFNNLEKEATDIKDHVLEDEMKSRLDERLYSILNKIGDIDNYIKELT